MRIVWPWQSTVMVISTGTVSTRTYRRSFKLARSRHTTLAKHLQNYTLICRLQRIQVEVPDLWHGVACNVLLQAKIEL